MELEKNTFIKIPLPFLIYLFLIEIFLYAINLSHYSFYLRKTFIFSMRRMSDIVFGRFLNKDFLHC